MPVQCTCLVCGKTFFRFPSDIANGRSKHCSRACYHANTIPIAVRFARHIGAPESNGCILWAGAMHASGYGLIQKDGQSGVMVLAHRAAWEIANGPIPDNIEVCHNCPGGDNPRCINVAHLFLGTHADNMADMVAKERNARGEKVPQAKITEAIVRMIRERVANGETQNAIASDVGFNQAQVSRIVNSKAWRHVV